MEFSELRTLSIEDIDLILKDQLDLYSPKEIEELKEYRDYLLEQKQKQEEYKRKGKRLTTLVCPKCDGLNDSTNTKCIYCEYQFKERDYHAKESVHNGESEDTTDSINAPVGRLLFGFLFSGGGVASIIYGCNTNNSVEAQWASFWNNGSTDPETVWIILGIIATVLGFIMLFSAF